jgi:heterotetrameric sarcosine oxidase gamma subunit
MPQSPLEGRTQLNAHSGVSFQELSSITQFQVIVRKGKSTALGKKLAPLEGREVDGLFICATGPGEYWVMAEKHDAHDVEAMLLKQFGETASLFDQSHGRVMLRIEGPRAADILAKGSPLDLDAMPASGAAHTVIDYIPALLAWRDGFEGVDVSIPRSYAVSFVTWLAEAALEFTSSGGTTER